MAVTVGEQPQRIEGRGYSVRELFHGHRYGLEYYQREYGWTRSHVVDLLTDLDRRFSDQWKPDHGRDQVAGYQPYFLGPFVAYKTPEAEYLVDGQQRFTTLLLLLIYLRRLLAEQGDPETAGMLDGLIRTIRFGSVTFTIDVEERAECLRCLQEGREFAVGAATPVSVRNLWQRGQDLAEDFPAWLRGESLPFFVDWLVDRVFLVEISARDRSQGWEIFETMNDRGSRPTSLDLLKGFLLSRVEGRHDASTASGGRW